MSALFVCLVVLVCGPRVRTHTHAHKRARAHTHTHVYISSYTTSLAPSRAHSGRVLNFLFVCIGCFFWFLVLRWAAWLTGGAPQIQHQARASGCRKGAQGQAHRAPSCGRPLRLDGRLPHAPGTSAFWRFGFLFLTERDSGCADSRRARHRWFACVAL